jgi:hypothetical protein
MVYGSASAAAVVLVLLYISACEVAFKSIALLKVNSVVTQLKLSIASTMPPSPLHRGVTYWLPIINLQNFVGPVRTLSNASLA